jgi:cytochrome c oxidase cbb3-type subunit I
VPAGPLHALPVVQRVTHLNNWVIAHSHLGVLGFAGTIGLAGMWLITPRITGRPLYDRSLADIQYWLIIFGLTAFHLIFPPRASSRVTAGSTERRSTARCR